MKRNLLLSLLLVVGISSFSLTGCKSDSTSATTNNQATIASEDAAGVVTEAVSSTSGGLNDQLTDVADFVKGSGVSVAASELSVASLAPSSVNSVVKTRTFNAADTTWTMTLQRTYSGTNLTGTWTREYHYWFSKNGFKQQSHIGSDKIGFEIVSAGCTGSYTTPHLSHKLKSLSGSITGAIDLTAKTITINSTAPYTRSAVDTITTRNAVRTSDHTLTLTLTNVVVPIESRAISSLYARPISGTISGEYVANITFEKNTLYSEKTVDRTFTINFGSDSGTTASIQISGNGGAGSYSGKFDLGTGVLQ